MWCDAHPDDAGREPIGSGFGVAISLTNSPFRCIMPSMFFLSIGTIQHRDTHPGHVHAQRACLIFREKPARPRNGRLCNKELLHDPITSSAYPLLDNAIGFACCLAFVLLVLVLKSILPPHSVCDGKVDCNYHVTADGHIVGH